MFDALLICVLCSFVALMIKRSVNVKKLTHKKHREKKTRKKNSA